MRRPDAAKSDWVARTGAVADLFAIEPLWQALYKHQKEHGMFLEVSPDSFKDWADSMKAALGRFTCLFVTEHHGELIGFVAGRVRALPRYFGGFQVGFVSEVFVAEAHRKMGLAREMLELATEWFANQGAHRIELMVLTNTGARQAYRELGWKEELIHMVWELPAKK